MVGKEFSERFQNVMTVTSLNDDGYRTWKIIEMIDDDNAMCELIGGNMEMIQGGYFEEKNIKNNKMRNGGRDGSIAKD